MSRASITIIAIVAFILLAIVTVIPLFEKFKKYSLFKKFYTTTAVVFLFLFGGLDVYIRASDPGETDKLIAAINRIQIAIGLKNKPNIVTVTDVHKNEPKTLKPVGLIKPRLFAFIRFGKISLSKTIKQDSLDVGYILINTGNSDAFKVKISTMGVVIWNGKIIPMPQKSSDTYGESFSLFPGKIGGDSGLSSLNIVGIKADSIYFCYKLDYSDSSKNRKSFTKIYAIEHGHEYMDEPNINIDKKIRAYLVKEKYWRPPLKQ